MLAYATTVHKSQGSEPSAVVIPLTTQHYPVLQRNLVYTGVPRGKHLVVLMGSGGTCDRRQGSAGTEAMVEVTGLADRQC